MSGGLTAVALDRDTVMAFIRLKVAASQTTFIAPNSETIAQACFAPGTTLRGLCWDGEPAGLYSVINPKLALNDPHNFQPGCAFLWRFMVDQGFQGKRLGAQALRMIFDTAVADGFAGLTLTAVDGQPGCPVPFYRKQGFARTGRMQFGEVELMKRIAQ